MAASMGSAFLAKRLNELLLHHIRQRLPELQTKVNSALASARAEVAAFGDQRLEGGSNQGALVLQLIHKFCTNYTEAIDGTSAQVQEASRQSGELLGGAKLNHIFREQVRAARTTRAGRGTAPVPQTRLLPSAARAAPPRLPPRRAPTPRRER